MQLFATFVKNKCNFFDFLVQQKLALVIESCIFTSLATVVSLQQTKHFAFNWVFMKK